MQTLERWNIGHDPDAKSVHIIAHLSTRPLNYYIVQDERFISFQLTVEFAVIQQDAYFACVWVDVAIKVHSLHLAPKAKSV